MKSVTIKNICLATVACLLGVSCAKKLDLFPTNNVPAEQVFKSAEGYKGVLAKIYGGLATTGNQGPAGQSDIQGLDEGSQSPFIRGFFNCQELPTDEAMVTWNDQTIQDYHNLRWTSADPFLKGMYARPIYNISIINEYLRQAADEKLSANGITGTEAEEVKKTVAEVRFLRAFNYWVIMDLFGYSTFITEENLPGLSNPTEINRTELFNYIEGELKEIDASLAPAHTLSVTEYGRVDQAAAWALLARMYLNAKVYTGTAKYAEAITYSKKVIDAGYSLQPNYAKLFMADNDKQKEEFIFAVNCDGVRTSGYGNTSFFVHAACGDDHNDYGVAGGWYGYRATSSLTKLFAANDKRALFSNLDKLEIKDVSNFNDGPHVRKYINKRSDGTPASSAEFADIDFPVFRLAEMYLIYAEAVKRGGTGGTEALALTYINMIRERAYEGISGNLTDFTLDDLLNERGRELFWEGHRRTDLIRYEKLTTGNYLWPWKGGVATGTAVDSKYNIFPVPADFRNANPNLSQNGGF